jgi:hypothetical protein
LVDGDVEVDFSEKDRWLVLRRARFLVAFSVAGEAVRLPIPKSAEIILRSSEEIATTDGALMLVPNSVAVLRTI